MQDQHDDETKPKKPIILDCGCAANATNGLNEPSCAVHGSSTPAKTQPNLEFRMAKCDCCRSEATSSTNLPFFKYQPKYPTDAYYCGCRGWN